MLRPRHESPTPLLRLAFPVLLVVVVVVLELQLDHPLAAIVPGVVALVLLAPLLLLVRGWVATTALGVAVALGVWGVGFAVYLALHPPE